MAGQTLSEIRTLLAEHDLRPRHRFGQNFLVDLNLMRKLVTAAEIQPGEVVLEVGPGTGSLTELLLAQGATVVASEIDRNLAGLLRSRFAHEPNFELIEGDALARKHDIAPAVLQAVHERAPCGSFKLVANLPYQIATPLLIDLLQLRAPRVILLCCTVQKEVADRLEASAGEPDYGPLSVVAQTLGKVARIANLPPQAFWPAPKVASAMVRLAPRPTNEIGVTDPATFARFVQEIFAQRRKTLRRVLNNRYPNAAGVLDEVKIPGDARPEQLSPSQWRDLAAAVSRR